MPNFIVKLVLPVKRALYRSHIQSFLGYRPMRFLRLVVLLATNTWCTIASWSHIVQALSLRS